MQSDSAIKNLKGLYLHLQQPETLNHEYNSQHPADKRSKPKLLSGISDVLQIYADHSTFIYKSLISINLRLVSMVSFKLDNVRVRIMCGQGADLFPSSINSKVKCIEEIAPHGTKVLSFCLRVEEVETLFVSFDV